MPSAAQRPSRDAAGGQPVHVLGRVQPIDHRIGVEAVGERQLDEDPVDGGVGVQPVDHRVQLVLRGLRREAHRVDLEPGLGGGAVLVPHVDLARRILPDEDDGEAGLDAVLGELGGGGAHLGADGRRGGLAVEELGLVGGHTGGMG